VILLYSIKGWYWLYPTFNLAILYNTVRAKLMVYLDKKGLFSASLPINIGAAYLPVILLQ
jgi:hypothetical protein